MQPPEDYIDLKILEIMREQLREENSRPRPTTLLQALSYNPDPESARPLPPLVPIEQLEDTEMTDLDADEDEDEDEDASDVGSADKWSDAASDKAVYGSRVRSRRDVPRGMVRGQFIVNTPEDMETFKAIMSSGDGIPPGGVIINPKAMAQRKEEKAELEKALMPGGNLDPAEYFGDKWEQLKDMGFVDEVHNVKALLKKSGDVEGAIGYLLMGGGA
jgi:hypothetical protein